VGGPGTGGEPTRTTAPSSSAHACPERPPTLWLTTALPRHDRVTHVVRPITAKRYRASLPPSQRLTSARRPRLALHTTVASAQLTVAPNRRLGAPYWRCHTLRRSVPMRAQRPTPPMRAVSPEAVGSGGNLTSGRVRHQTRALYAHSSQVSRAHACWGAAGVPLRHITAPCRRTCAADAHPALIWPMRTAPVGADAFDGMSSTFRPPTARPLDDEPMRSSLRHTLAQRHAGEVRGSVGTTESAPCGPALPHLTGRRRSVPSSRSRRCDRPNCSGWM